jgi:hypothetical protein
MRSSLKRRHIAAASLFTAVALVALPSAPPAQAAQDTDTVTVNVDVGSGITLTLSATSFTLGGIPGSTDEQLGAVGLTVFTNNAAGYSVTVDAATATLDGVLGGTIPVGDLEVKNSAGTYTPLAVGAPITVHTQATPSGGTGDVLSNDYQIHIPAVAADTYTGTLNYIAATL